MSLRVSPLIWPSTLVCPPPGPTFNWAVKTINEINLAFTKDLIHLGATYIVASDATDGSETVALTHLASVAFDFRGRPVILCCGTSSRVAENYEIIRRHISGVRSKVERGLADHGSPDLFACATQPGFYVVLDYDYRANRIRAREKERIAAEAAQAAMRERIEAERAAMRERIEAERAAMRERIEAEQRAARARREREARDRERAFDELRPFFLGAALEPDCWTILGLKPGADAAAVKRAYRRKSRTEHPDVGGNNDRMVSLNRARDEAQKHLCGRAK